MNRMTAVLGGEHDETVRAAANALAAVLGLGVRWFRAPGVEAPDRIEQVVAALESDDVEVGVVGVDTPADGCWDVLPLVSRPLLVVPVHAPLTAGSFVRVLVPLDGREETAASVVGMAGRLRGGGAEVVAVHVFEPATIPAFWDQAAHSHASWTAEFLRRNLPPAAGLGLRRGSPADELIAESGESGVDLLLVGWSQDLSSGHAHIVRSALTAGSVPVLLVPAQVHPPTAGTSLPRPGTFGTLGGPGRGRRT